MTSGLTLDVTVNTDFAQAEVDEQQVNLTRFPLFFPEKRDFFLENSGQFTVSKQGTRRGSRTCFSAGGSGSRRPASRSRMIGGARLTGKVGDHNIAVMELQTREGVGRPGENFLVARYSRDCRPAVEDRRARDQQGGDRSSANFNRHDRGRRVDRANAELLGPLVPRPDRDAGRDGRPAGVPRARAVPEQQVEHLRASSPTSRTTSTPRRDSSRDRHPRRPSCISSAIRGPAA